MALDLEGNIHVVWVEFNDTASYLRYIMKPRGSSGFNPPVEVDLPVRMKYNATAPKIRVDKERTVHVVWGGITEGIHPYEVFYARLVKNGKKFTYPIILTSEMQDFRCRYPQIDIDSAMKIHVVFYCARNDYMDTITLYYTYSNDGVVFTQPIQLPYHNFYTLCSYSFKVSERNKDLIYFTWTDQDNKTSNYTLWFGKSSNGGKTFVAPRRLSTSADSHTPIIVAGMDGLLWIFYFNVTATGNRIEYIQSFDEGKTFTSPTAIVGISRCPSPPAKIPPFTSTFDVIESIEGNFLGIVWTEKKGTDCEIISKKILEMKTILVEKNKNGYSSYPRLRLWNDNVAHFIWFDDRTGNYQIYYKRYDTSPPIIQYTPIKKSYVKNNISIIANLSDNWGIQSATLHYKDYGSQDFSLVPFTLLQGSVFNGKWNATIPAPMRDTRILYYISVFDGVNIANTSINSIEIWSYAPSFFHIPISNASVNTTIVIQVVAWDDLEVKNVTLYFGLFNSSFSSLEMKLINGSHANGTWEGLLPPQNKKSIIQYRIEIDDGTNKNISKTYEIEIRDSQRPSPHGQSEIDWRPLLLFVITIFVILFLILILKRKKRMTKKGVELNKKDTQKALTSRQTRYTRNRKKRNAS